MLVCKKCLLSLQLQCIIIIYNMSNLFYSFDIGANLIYISECARFHKHCTFILNRDYRAEYEKLKAEKEQKERSRQKDQMSRLQNDVNLGGQGDMEGT